LWRMGPRCSSAETQVCHRSYIIAATSRYVFSCVICFRFISTISDPMTVTWQEEQVSERQTT
jgi:hypothetical protein